MNNKKINSLAFVICISFLYVACKCGNLNCEALNDKFKKYANYKIADSLVYDNGNGQKLIFKVDSVYENNSGEIDCPGSPFSGTCKCGCPIRQKQIIARLTNDSRILIWDSTFMQSKNYNQLIYDISQDENSKDSICKIHYSVFNFGSNNINADYNNIYSNTNNIYHNTILLNNKTYTDVIETNHDTLPKPIKGGTIKGLVWKTYYAKNVGIVAFGDRITKSIFYLK